MPVIGIIVDGHCPDKPSATAGSCNTDLAAELIALMGFALTDAFHMGFMGAVNFLFIMLLLFEDADADIKQVLLLSIRLRAIAFNVPNDSAKIIF